VSISSSLPGREVAAEVDLEATENRSEAPESHEPVREDDCEGPRYARVLAISPIEDDLGSDLLAKLKEAKPDPIRATGMPEIGYVRSEICAWRTGTPIEVLRSTRDLNVEEPGPVVRSRTEKDVRERGMVCETL
jgi:hypothetical protein